jgi:hypothetical protein
VSGIPSDATAGAVPMSHRRTVTLLVALIALAAAVATIRGIFSSGGPGPYQHVSVRGVSVTVYGVGLYRDMSAEVAPQEIAPDYVTLFVGIPLLLGSLVWAWRGSVRGRLLLAGTLGYFFVTYLLYLAMAMYNVMFLAYVLLLSASFFALSLVLLDFDIERLARMFSRDTPVRTCGGFLIFSAIMIALLWLSVVIPPLMRGAVIPPQVEHYTTLIVQGFDLALLLPLGFLSGLLLLRRRPVGFLLSPVYLVFLAVLMTALSAKVVAMGLLGFGIVPVVFIIPSLNAASIGLAVTMLSRIRDEPDLAARTAAEPILL